MSRTTTSWPQVLGLAGLQLAIRFLWIIYDFYLPQLLTGLGIGLTTAIILVSVENGVAALLEPVVGSLSDQHRQHLASRSPWILGGILAAAGLFALLPWIQVPWLLITVVLLWAGAMSLFRTPATALLGTYAAAGGLNQANSALTVVNGLTSTVSPFLTTVILGWGSAAAFVVGSVVLLAAAAMLWNLEGQQPVVDIPVRGDRGSLPIRALACLFIAGVGVLLTVRVFMGTVPMVVAGLWPGIRIEVLIGATFLGMAIPAGGLGDRWGSRTALWAGVAGMLASVILTISLRDPEGALSSLQAVLGLAIAVLFGLSFSVISTSAIPWALELGGTGWGGTAIGCFFGGGGAAIALFNALGSQVKASIPLVLGIGIPALLITSLAVGLALLVQPEPLDADASR